jgi:hypothetical protein
MVVEAAVVVPVVIAMAIVVFNLASFVEACALFDRVALDAVVCVGAAPTSSSASDAANEVRVAIEDAMGGLRGVSVSVRAVSLWDDLAAGLGFTVAPHLTRYVCTLRYEPWPGGFSIAGVNVVVPPELVHERSFVVDRYKSAVIA